MILDESSAPGVVSAPLKPSSAGVTLTSLDLTEPVNNAPED